MKLKQHLKNWWAENRIAFMLGFYLGGAMGGTMSILIFVVLR